MPTKRPAIDVDVSPFVNFDSLTVGRLGFD